MPRSTTHYLHPIRRSIAIVMSLTSMWAILTCLGFAVYSGLRGVSFFAVWSSALVWSAEVAPWVLPMYLTVFVAAAAVVVLPELQGAADGDPARVRQQADVRRFAGVGAAVVAAGLANWWVWTAVGTFLPGPAPAGNGGVLLGVVPLLMLAVLVARASRETPEQELDSARRAHLKNLLWLRRLRAFARVDRRDTPVAWPKWLLLSSLVVSVLTVLYSASGNQWGTARFSALAAMDVALLAGGTVFWGRRYFEPLLPFRMLMAGYAICFMGIAGLTRSLLMAGIPSLDRQVVLAVGLVVPVAVIFIPAFGRRALASYALLGVTRRADDSASRVIELARRVRHAAQPAAVPPRVRRRWPFNRAAPVATRSRGTRPPASGP